LATLSFGGSSVTHAINGNGCGRVVVSVTATPDGGKKVNWYMGRIPGVIEEAILTLQAKRPTYLCGGFGGAAALVAKLLEGEVPHEFTWEYQSQAPHSTEMLELYKKHGIPWQGYEELADICKGIGVKGLSAANHLTEADLNEWQPWSVRMQSRAFLRSAVC
jgi:hypothetical protein